MQNGKGSLVRPLLAGAAAAVVMLAIYLVLVALAQGWVSAFELLVQDWYLVAPITLSFAAQVGMFTYLRAVLHLRAKGSAAMTGASGGTSTAAMVACCAHRVADLIPLLGLSAAASFLAAYRVPLMLVGLAVSLTGVYFIARRIVRYRKGVRDSSTEEALMAGGKMVRDPVCGMEVDPAKAAATRTHEGQKFHFCSAGCAKTFDSDPHRYGHATGTQAAH